MPRRSGGSFALSSGGNVKVNGAAIYFDNVGFQFSCAWKRLPVTPFDSSEARKTKTSVTPAGFAHSDGSSSGSAARCIAVFILPGSTQLMRTPLSSSSDAHVCDMPSRPNLEMPYAPQPG